MNRSLRTLALGTAAAIGLVTPALAAAHTSAPSQPDRSTTVVRHFHVKPLSFIDTHPGYVALDADFNGKGKRVGSDVTTCRPGKREKRTARCDVGLGLRGGLITITFTQSSGSKKSHGRITGGTGAFAGVSGTVLIKEHKRGAVVTATIRRP